MCISIKLALVHVHGPLSQSRPIFCHLQTRLIQFGMFKRLVIRSSPLWWTRHYSSEKMSNKISVKGRSVYEGVKLWNIFKLEISKHCSYIPWMGAVLVYRYTGEFLLFSYPHSSSMFRSFVYRYTRTQPHEWETYEIHWQFWFSSITQ